MDFQPQLGRSVSLEQAERHLQISRRTLYYWIRDGRLQTIRTLGGSQRVLLDSLRTCRPPRAAAAPVVAETAMRESEFAQEIVIGLA